MLEHPGLLLGPWRWEAPASARAPQAAAGRHRARPVLDLQTLQPLGLVRQRRPRGWAVWRWLTRRTWQVLETEDESLLLTLYGPWGLVRPWEVRDADDRLVCSIHAGGIYDAAGHLQGRVSPEQGRTVILAREKIELAHVAHRPGGLEVRFAPHINADPYAKMAMLGAALTLERS